MLQPGESKRIGRRGYALCVGIGTYTHLANRNLRYAMDDATIIAERLADPQRGDFAVTVLTEPAQTTKVALEEAVEQLLSAPDRRAEDLVLLYFSCHGDLNRTDHTFCLLPSNATLKDNRTFEQTTLISIHDIARWFSKARTHNIVLLLDVCHSGGAGTALQHFKLNLDTGPNFFIIGAVRQDQIARQSSTLEHGLFTHCLLRAFEQPPTKDGWLTISQIQDFVSEDISWFASAADHPFQIQVSSVFVNPQLPLLKNPGYPELSPLPPIWNVPWPRNPFFTGQEHLLSQLASMLQSDQKTALTQPQAINGLGGIGKTQLALEYAYRHRQDYHAVLWGRADSCEALISTFVNIAYLLDLPQKDEKDQMVTVEAVKAWLASRSRWLFILDNADELALVREFIPPAFRGHLLLTTRAQATGGLARELEVDVMQPETGAMLLLRRSRRLALDEPLEKASSMEIREAKELAQELGGLPLALDQAGAYMEEVHCRLIDYRDRYRAQSAKLLQRRGGLVSDHPEPVATTWLLSFAHVEQANPAAADLLRVCAFLAPDVIPESMLIAGAKELGPHLAPLSEDLIRLDEALAVLRRFSLIHRQQEEEHAISIRRLVQSSLPIHIDEPTMKMWLQEKRTLSIHRLVQSSLLIYMDEPTMKMWAERTMRAINAAFPDVQYYQIFLNYREFLPHILNCVHLINHWDIVLPEAARLLNQIASFLIQESKYTEAEGCYQRAIVIEEKALGPEHPYVANLLNNLVNLYHLQERYSEEELLYQRILAIDEKTLGSEHPQLAGHLNNLANLYLVQGKHVEAEAYYQRAIAIDEKTLGSEHSQLSGHLQDLVNLYTRQGRYPEAEACYQRAIANGEKTLGSEHPLLANLLNNLAILYHIQQRCSEEEPLYQRILAIGEKTFGPEHPKLFTLLNDLAVSYILCENLAEAEVLYQRAIAIGEKTLGPEHPKLIIPLRGLETLYYLQERYSEIKVLLKRVTTIEDSFR